MQAMALILGCMAIMTLIQSIVYVSAGICPGALIMHSTVIHNWSLMESPSTFCAQQLW